MCARVCVRLCDARLFPFPLAQVTPTRKEVLDEFAQRLTRAVFSQIRTSPEVEVADVKAQAVQELKAEYPEVDVEEIVRQHTETLLKRRAAADNAVAAAGSAAVSAALGAAVAIPTGGLEGHGMTVPLLTGGKRKHDDLDAGQKRRRRFLGTGYVVCGRGRGCGCGCVSLHVCVCVPVPVHVPVWPCVLAPLTALWVWILPCVQCG